MLPERSKSILTRNDSPDIPFEQSINPYRGCEHGCVYCLSGDTQILMGDGATKALADLRVGDQVYGTEKRGHYRRFVRTQVLAHWRTTKPVWSVRLADGTALRSSADHRLLTERGWKFVAADRGSGQRPHLTCNNTLMGFGALPKPPPIGDVQRYRRGYLCGVIRGDGHLAVYRYTRVGRANGDQHRFRLAMADAEALDRSAAFLMDSGVATDRFEFAPATTRRRRMEAIRTSAQHAVAAIGKIVEWPECPDIDWARGFIGGLFDAEGSFDGTTLRISNTDPRIIQVLTDALGALRFRSVVETARRDTEKPVHYVRLRGGLREHLRLFGMIDPAISRKRDIEGLAVKSPTDLSVVEVGPPGGSAELFDITTGTGDFVANGLISHNCYARPSHSIVGLSPGLDFETRLFYKSDAANLLRRELARPGYRCSPIMLGANTDPYQPLEKRLRVTRSILEVLLETRHPVMLITKGALLERDLDLLADLARDRLVTVAFSLPTLDVALKRLLEPRAASPQARLRMMQRCASRGIPVAVMVAPVIPVLTDPQIERVLEASAAAGASRANFIMLRLPYEVAGLFGDWLREHFPDRAAHVMARVHEMRSGRANDPCFGTRMSGVGEWAGMIRQRFAVACRRLQLSQSRGPPLDVTQFRPPRIASAAESCGQLTLEL